MDILIGFTVLLMRMLSTMQKLILETQTVSRESGSKELGSMGQKGLRSNGLLNIGLQVVAVTTMEDRGLEKGGTTIILRRFGRAREVLSGEASTVEVVSSEKKTNLPRVQSQLEDLIPPANQDVMLVGVNKHLNNSTNTGLPLMVKGQDYVLHLGGQDVDVLGLSGSISQPGRIIPYRGRHEVGDESFPEEGLVVPPYVEQGVDRQVEHHVTGSLDVQQILGRGEEELAEVARGDEELTGGNVSL